MQREDSLPNFLTVARGSNVEARYELAARETLDPEVEMILATDPDDAVRGNLLMMSRTRSRAAILVMEGRERDPILREWIALQVNASADLKMGVELRKLSIDSLEAMFAEIGLPPSLRNAVLMAQRSQQTSDQRQVETVGDLLARLASD